METKRTKTAKIILKRSIQVLTLPNIKIYYSLAVKKYNSIGERMDTK